MRGAAGLALLLPAIVLAAGPDTGPAPDAEAHARAVGEQLGPLVAGLVQDADVVILLRFDFTRMDADQAYGWVGARVRQLLAGRPEGGRELLAALVALHEKDAAWVRSFRTLGGRDVLLLGDERVAGLLYGSLPPDPVVLVTLEPGAPADELLTLVRTGYAPGEGPEQIFPLFLAAEQVGDLIIAGDPAPVGSAKRSLQALRGVRAEPLEEALAATAGMGAQLVILLRDGVSPRIVWPLSALLSEAPRLKWISVGLSVSGDGLRIVAQAPDEAAAQEVMARLETMLRDLTGTSEHAVSEVAGLSAAEVTQMLRHVRALIEGITPQREGDRLILELTEAQIDTLLYDHLRPMLETWEAAQNRRR